MCKQLCNIVGFVQVYCAVRIRQFYIFAYMYMEADPEYQIGRNIRKLLRVVNRNLYQHFIAYARFNINTHQQ